MKKAIAVAALIFGVALLKNYRPARETQKPTYKVATPVPAQSAPVPAFPAVAAPSGVDPLVYVNQQLAVLNEQLLRTEQELQATGFPKVLLDNRLSKREREEILAKTLRASALQDQVAMLKIQKIDMEADRKSWAN